MKPKWFEFPYHRMHGFLYIYILEIQRQASLAKEIKPDLNYALNKNDSVNAFRLLHALLYHLVQIFS